jgi:hypothetical protein
MAELYINLHNIKVKSDLNSDKLILHVISNTEYIYNLGLKCFISEPSSEIRKTSFILI